ncbi:glycine cleavage system protein H [Crateriforma conspicua]|nr:glycine cleavage system protein H [Crateriforma conspicua]
MNSTLTFAMGDYQAEFPTDRRFVANHMWATGPDEAGSLRFGLTAYAVRLLQDVYFLDWTFQPGQAVKHRAEIGSIESKKAESDLYAPIAGVMSVINDAVLDDPSQINADCYGNGWLFEMRPSDGRIDSMESDHLMSPDEYLAHLEKAWEVAQRTIKGQANL